MYTRECSYQAGKTESAAFKKFPVSVHDQERSNGLLHVEQMSLEQRLQKVRKKGVHREARDRIRSSLTLYTSLSVHR